MTTHHVTSCSIGMRIAIAIMLAAALALVGGAARHSAPVSHVVAAPIMRPDKVLCCY
jgi:hypothetical protein